jgi:gluconolactonase
VSPVDQHGAIRVLAAGAGFTEGPVVNGDRIEFVSINRGLIYSAALDGGGFETLAEVGGGPNALARDREGTLWIAQNGGRVMEGKSFPAAPGLQRLDGSSSTTVAPDDVNAPNDLVPGPDGRIWFTDPHGRLMDATAEPVGKVRAYDPGTGEFEVVADGLRHPNGLCFSADGGSLYVSDTKDLTILRLDRTADGWQPPVVHAAVPFGQPDGMALDEDGSLWVAATDAEGIAVLHPDGTWSLVELGPSFPTNVCFAGPDRRTLVVTAARGGRLLALDVPVAGLSLT